MCRPISRMLLAALVAGGSCSVTSIAYAGQAGQRNALDFIIPLIEGMNQAQQGQNGQYQPNNPGYQPNNPNYQSQNPNYQPNNPNYNPNDHDHNHFVPERRVVPNARLQANEPPPEPKTRVVANPRFALTTMDPAQLALHRQLNEMSVDQQLNQMENLLRAAGVDTNNQQLRAQIERLRLKAKAGMAITAQDIQGLQAAVDTAVPAPAPPPAG